MDRFEYSTSSLMPNESYMLRAYNIQLYDGDSKTSYDKGEVILTSHRLLWCLPGDSQNLSLNLKYVSSFKEEKQSNFIFSRSRKLILHLSDRDINSLPGPVPSSSSNFIKLSFKDKLDMEFVSALSQVLEQKRWEIVDKSQRDNSQGEKSRPNIKLRTGIIGIERGLIEKQKAENESISIAFQDLNKLMIMAKEMVDLSKNISTKLKDKYGDITNDEIIKFKSYLLSLGIDDPVTKDAFQSDAEFFEKLGNEICQIIEKPLREAGGIMALADVFCRVNRARGLELLSPEDFLSGCKMLAKMRSSVILREFDSGVKVLQLANHSDDAVVKETYELLKNSVFMTPEDLAKMLGISMILAKERLITTEKFGKACRDESIEGLKFYLNKFLEEDA